MLELIIGILVLVVVYYVVVGEMSWIAGVKQTGNMIATVVAHTPETIVVTKEFLVTNDKEYRAEIAKTGTAYTESYKTAYKDSRKASKEFWKDTRTDLATRLDKATKELDALDTAANTTE